MLAAVIANAPRARAARTPLRTRMLAMVSPNFGLLQIVPNGIIALEGNDVNFGRRRCVNNLYFMGLNYMTTMDFLFIPDERAGGARE